jgi:hypothetical protein
MAEHVSVAALPFAHPGKALVSVSLTSVITELAVQFQGVSEVRIGLVVAAQLNGRVANATVG